MIFQKKISITTICESFSHEYAHYKRIGLHLKDCLEKSKKKIFIIKCNENKITTILNALKVFFIVGIDQRQQQQQTNCPFDFLIVYKRQENFVELKGRNKARVIYINPCPRIERGIVKKAGWINV